MATGPEHYLKAITSLPLIHEETDGAWAIARAVESLTHAVLMVGSALGTYGIAEDASACCVAAETFEHDEALVGTDVDTTDSATEAFVDAADAERYAQRDEYVNGDRRPCTCSTDPEACRAFGRAEELAATDDGREPDDVYAEGERQAEDARLAEENEAEWQAARDAEAAAPSVADMRQIFGEPVEGRDYNVMPGGES